MCEKKKQFSRAALEMFYGPEFDEDVESNVAGSTIGFGGVRLWRYSGSIATGVI